MSTFKIIKRFRRDEDGVGTIMALFWFIICAGIVGLSVDATNAWRQKERLQLAADTASHAGLLKVLAGGTAAEIRQAAHNSAITNMPTASFGRVINADSNDIILSHYSDATNTLSEPATLADVNGVTVQLHRNNTVNNPVGTYLLQFVGFPSWQVKRFGTTVINDFEQCPMNEGIWAHGAVHANSESTFGKDFCVHSQEQVWLPQRSAWASGSYLGMPSLLKCFTDGKCENSANAGIEEAMNELNLQLPDFGDLVQTTRDSMLDSGTNTLKSGFWTGKTLETDPAELQPLVDMGAIPDPADPIYDPATYAGDPLYDPDSSIFDPASADYDPDAVLQTVPEYPLELGYVVEVSKSEFESLEKPPSGLTYWVTCTGGGVNGIVEMLPFTDPATGGYGHVEDVAMITDTCSVDFTDNSDWRGSMVLTTDTPNGANPTFKASAAASVGDPTQSCTQSDHTYLLTSYDMNVAAQFASSNTTFIAGRDFTMAAASATDLFEHWGMTLFADGEVDLRAQHDFHACGYDGNGFFPIEQYRYIKQVMPTNEKERIAAFN